MLFLDKGIERVSEKPESDGVLVLLQNFNEHIAKHFYINRAVKTWKSRHFIFWSWLFQFPVSHRPTILSINPFAKLLLYTFWRNVLNSNRICTLRNNSFLMMNLAVTVDPFCFTSLNIFKSMTKAVMCFIFCVLQIILNTEWNIVVLMLTCWWNAVWKCFFKAQRKQKIRFRNWYFDLYMRKRRHHAPTFCT